MRPIELILLVLAAGLATFLTRSLPFFLLSRGAKRWPFLTYLAKVLPAAALGLLLVFIFRLLPDSNESEQLASAIGILSVVLLHRFKGKLLLSVAGGTLVYGLLTLLI